MSIRIMKTIVQAMLCAVFAACLLMSAQVAFADEGSSDVAEPATRTTADFSDLKVGEWYTEYVDYVASRKIINGYEDGTFGPNKPLTRAQVVTILWNMSGNPVVEDDGYAFTDVNYGPNSWYGEAVRWARANSVVSGVGNDQFLPHRSVTREEFAVMLANYTVNYLGFSIDDDDAFASGIEGYDKAAGWARSALAWAVNEGIMSGTVDKAGVAHLDPKAVAQRAAGAKMIAVFHSQVLIPVMTAHREQQVLESIAANVAQAGWEATLEEATDERERGYYVWVPFEATPVVDGDFDAAGAADAQRIEAVAQMTKSARAFALAHDVDLPVYGIMTDVDGTEVYIARNGETVVDWVTGGIFYGGTASA